MSQIEFRGVSGQVHRFSAHRPNEAFPAAPGVYCFARAEGRGFAPLFLSRTGNLAERLANHEQWAAAQLLGATHVLVHERGARDAREYVEADLFASLRPVMNGPVLDAEAQLEGDGRGPRLVWAA